MCGNIFNNLGMYLFNSEISFDIQGEIICYLLLQFYHIGYGHYFKNYIQKFFSEKLPLCLFKAPTNVK